MNTFSLNSSSSALDIAKILPQGFKEKAYSDLASFYWSVAQSEIIPPVKLSTAPVIPLDWSEEAKTSALASSASVVNLFV